jgi:cytochrome c oxidase subunit I
MIVFVVNLVYSMVRGEVALPNPWRSRSPEWQLPSPAPVHNYAVPIEVIGEPYDYGLENSVFVNLPELPPDTLHTPPQAAAPAGAAD